MTPEEDIKRVEELAEKKEEQKKNVQAKELIDAEISEEMKKAYIDYAMSVIVSRALPAAEDGLKPVHRRILWAMHQMGLQHNKQTKKSARIVGDTMGKFHPHGDLALYDALVRMAQNFSLRYPLVIGQGNFGSRDGDSAAAMRYTEAKMEKISEELLQDIEKKTVQMRPNFDNTLDEPTILPGKIPNLLLNGSQGIAVGMTTNIPPHNLINTCDAILKFIDKPKCEIKELIQEIKAPDFPTGGYVSGEIKQIYEEGKGRLTIRGKTKTEESKKSSGKTKIIITEIPYQVNKASLVKQIAELVKDKRLPDISDLRDESSKGNVRVVIELRKGSNSQFTINRLFKYTKLQNRFDAVMLALVNGQPKQLNLKQIIETYVNHRRKIIRKRTEFDLDRAEKRLHIVLGLLIVQKNIDEIIRLIKKSKLVSEASEILQKRFKLTPRQAQAILEIRLQQLTSLEFDKLKKEEKELKELIKELKTILGNEKEILKIIKSELKEIKKNYGDDRRTTLLGSVKEFEEKDLIDKKDVVVSITDKGYVKRLDIKSYKEQKRGGKGVIGSDLSTEDFVKEMITCSTHDYLMFFTNQGRVYWLKTYNIPAAERYSKGRSIINLLNLKDEKIASVMKAKDFNDFLIIVTKTGHIKKMRLNLFSKPRLSGVRAINIPSGDEVIDVKTIKEKQEIILVTKKGQAIRFNSNEVRTMGRASYGVTGIKLSKTDEVVSVEVLPLGKSDSTILTITEKGYGKRSKIEDYRLIRRAGKGVINLKVSSKTGNVVKTVSADNQDSIIVTTAKGMVIRTSTKDLRVMGRATQGVRIVKLRDDDKVSDLVKVLIDEGEEKEE